MGTCSENVGLVPYLGPYVWRREVASLLWLGSGWSHIPNIAMASSMYLEKSLSTDIGSCLGL